MDTAGVLLAGGRPADDGAQRDERGLLGLGLGGVEGVVQGGGVFLVRSILAEPVDALDVPAVGLVAGQDVLVEGDRGVVFDGDVVVVPDDGDVAQLLGASEGGGLGGDAFLEAAVASDDVDVVVEDGLAERGLGIEQAVEKPTAEAMPVPSGPVVISTPLVCPYSGWPGVREPAVRSFLMSSSSKPKPDR